MRSSKSNRLRTARRGAVLVEASLMLPLLFLLFFGIFEYGRFLMMLHVINNAAREGARYAVTHTQPITLDGVTYGATTGDVLAIVHERMGGTALSSQVVQVYESDNLGTDLGDWTDAQSGERICVRIDGEFDVIAGGLLFLPASIPVRAQAVLRSEAN